MFAQNTNSMEPMRPVLSFPVDIRNEYQPLPMPSENARKVIDDAIITAHIAEKL